MEINQIPLGPIGTNCYILSSEGQALVIDPGGEGEKVIERLDKEQLKVQAILLTHAHFDHIGAVDTIRDHYQTPVYVHSLEKDWLQDSNLNGSAHFGLPKVRVKEASHLFNKEEQLTIGQFSFEVRHTPGHSPGSVSFVFPDEKFVICGDALFQGSIGRTDLPGGSMDQLIGSIKEELLVLPDDYIAYPGHGPKTTIGVEREHNPFL